MALFYKTIPHYTYRKKEKKPAWSSKLKGLRCKWSQTGIDLTTASFLWLRSLKTVVFNQVHNANNRHVCRLVCLKECLDDGWNPPQSHTYLIMHHQDRAFKHRSTMTTSQFNFNSSTAGPGYYCDNKMLVHDETYWKLPSCGRKWQGCI